MDISEMLREMAAGRDDGDTAADTRLPEAVASDLKEKFALLGVKYDFKPGDLVQWKPGMKNKTTEGPFVVVEILTTPATPDYEESFGSQHWRMPLDIICGSVHRDGEFTLYHYDSRRFEPYTGPLA